MGHLGFSSTEIAVMAPLGQTSVQRQQFSKQYLSEKRTSGAKKPKTGSGV